MKLIKFQKEKFLKHWNRDPIIPQSIISNNYSYGERCSPASTNQNLCPGQGMTGHVCSFSRMWPQCVLTQEARIQDTVGMSEASGGLMARPRLLAKTRHRASLDSRSQNEFHLFFCFFFFLKQ